MADFKSLFSDLLDIEDNMEKYDWIIDYGAQSAGLDHKYQTEENSVKGCTSPLWLAKDTQGKVHAQGASHIVHGIANMLCDYYNQATEQERNAMSIGILADLGLMPLLSMGRQNGVANMIARLKQL